MRSLPRSHRLLTAVRGLIIKHGFLGCILGLLLGHVNIVFVVIDCRVNRPLKYCDIRVGCLGSLNFWGLSCTPNLHIGLQNCLCANQQGNNCQLWGFTKTLTLCETITKKKDWYLDLCLLSYPFTSISIYQSLTFICKGLVYSRNFNLEINYWVCFSHVNFMFTITE